MAQVESARVERYRPSRQTQGSSVADILERVLDKGIVITGDIKIFLTDVELLTIQIRLIICSVEKAQEIGLDWWKTNPAFSSSARQGLQASAREPAREEEAREEAAPPTPTKA